MELWGNKDGDLFTRRHPTKGLLHKPQYLPYLGFIKVKKKYMKKQKGVLTQEENKPRHHTQGQKVGLHRPVIANLPRLPSK
jgi:hypothetical protein